MHSVRALGRIVARVAAVAAATAVCSQPAALEAASDHRAAASSTVSVMVVRFSLIADVSTTTIQVLVHG